MHKFCAYKFLICADIEMAPAQCLPSLRGCFFPFYLLLPFVQAWGSSLLALFSCYPVPGGDQPAGLVEEEGEHLSSSHVLAQETPQKQPWGMLKPNGIEKYKAFKSGHLGPSNLHSLTLANIGLPNKFAGPVPPEIRVSIAFPSVNNQLAWEIVQCLQCSDKCIFWTNRAC